MLKLVAQFSSLKNFVFNFVETNISKVNSNFEIEPFHPKLSTTRSQKRKSNQQESTESVSEGLVSPIIVENTCHLDQDVSVAGPSRSKSPRIENSLLESLRTSLKMEITSEIKSLLVESQKEMLKLYKPKIGENVRENIEEETQNEVRSLYTPTKSLSINSTQNDPNESRNT